MKKHFEPALKISLEISRRDFFAAFALAGLCADSTFESSWAGIAIAAYKQADAMIEEAGKRTQNLESTTK